MPCDTIRKKKPEQIKVALARLEKALSVGTVRVTVGQGGSIAFQGWKDEDRGGLADLCAYRTLLSQGSIALRMAVTRAEAMAGRQVNAQAVAAGVHSHDGGTTWGTH